MRPVSQRQGLVPHFLGATLLLTKQDKKQLTSRYDTVLFHHVRQGAILKGILDRSHIPFSSEDWISISRSAPITNMETQLFDLGVMVPGLLADTDLLISELGSSTSSRDRLHLHALVAMSERIKQWIHDFRQARKVTMRDCNATTYPDYCAWLTSYPLEQAYMSRNFNDTWFMAMAWVYLFVLDGASLKFVSSRPALATEGTLRTITISIQSTTTNLCKLVPRFFDASFGFLGRVAFSLFLRVLTMYFKAQKDITMVSWYYKVESAVYAAEQGVALLWPPEWEIAFGFQDKDIR